MSTTGTTIDLEQQMLGEVEMVGRDRWEEIHRRAGAGGSIRAIARELDLDRKTVRRCLRQTEWKRYRRAARADTLLASESEYLRRRAAEVGYSAQVLFQELRRREYRGSYETVKRFVRPLRETQLHAAVTRTRFETPPGLQSQVDWGQARVRLGAAWEVRHVFVLTLGFSRRSVLRAVSERGAGRSARCARAGVRALRRAHAGASLRPAADGVRAVRDARRAVEHDVQGVRGLLGLRVLEAEFPGRPAIPRRPRLPRAVAGVDSDGGRRAGARDNARAVGGPLLAGA